MPNVHSRPRLNDEPHKLAIKTRTPAKSSPDNIIDAVNNLKRCAEIVNRLADQCLGTDLDSADLRLEALSDLCISARHLADDQLFRSLFDMALLHAGNRLFETKPQNSSDNVILVASQFPRAASDLGANI
jgi:hypothetical protein